ncbi:hypothetical protein U9M48_000743 [Paspalum notatum var. saurae]|uniref:Ubiquitin-like protease family profile domain-containing protein n=1 Tax=Paspalum notatum var. saurae TaxID=547442 RepID=A0AAQ3PHC8_PASNO
MGGGTATRRRSTCSRTRWTVRTRPPGPPLEAQQLTASVGVAVGGSFRAAVLLRFHNISSRTCRTNYEEQTRELRCGIHSVLQALMYSSEEFESRWSNYSILDWDVVVKKDIPRQHDGCSCGIFTIKYMQYWNGSEMTSPFSQKNMETFRKKMPAELILSPLNTFDSIKEHVPKCLLVQVWPLFARLCY